MTNKQQSKSPTQNQTAQIQTPQVPALLDLSVPIKENHLSASHELLLKYEQRNYEIEDATKSTSIPQDLIKQEMTESLRPSSLKGEQIFQKYGSMIENQPIFLRELIFHNYLPYLPERFQNEFSQLMLVGTGFEFAWWSSLAIVLFRGYRNRHVDASFRQKATKGLGMTFFFLLTSLGFHQEYYIPTLKNCYYKNIKSVDSLMDRHLKILKACGSSLESQQKIAEILNSQPQKSAVLNPQQLIQVQKVQKTENKPKASK